MELTWPIVMIGSAPLRIVVVGLGLLAAVGVASTAAARSKDELAETKDGNADSDPASPHDTSDGSDGPEDPEDVATNDKSKKTVTSDDKSFSHKGQFNVRLAIGAGYRVVMRYDRSPPCSSSLTENGDMKTFCGFGAPASLDTAIGYAPSPGIEPFIWGRFGLSQETDTRTAPLVIIGAGLRLYTMSDAAFKFFVEPAIGLELERGIAPGDNRSWQYKQDIIARLSLGPQLDFSRNVGVYVAGGLTIGTLRYLQSWMDLHLGIQARFP